MFHKSDFHLIKIKSRRHISQRRYRFNQMQRDSVTSLFNFVLKVTELTFSKNPFRFICEAKIQAKKLLT